MHAWVIGGSGLVGRSLVELLLAQSTVEHVLSLGRRRTFGAHPKLEERVVNLAELEQALAGVQASHAFCCIGTTMAAAGSKEAFRQVDFEYPLALARAARAAGAVSYLLVSAAGANPKSPFFYNRVKGEVEQALGELDFPRLHLLRPSLLLGERAEARPGERVAAVLARPLSGLFVGRLGKYAPIEARDVARALVVLADRADAGRHVHESNELIELAARLPEPGGEPSRNDNESC
ncbi:MAG: NAD-dependent epimerase/dehydratase family protein [Myxococcota bacterium]